MIGWIAFEVCNAKTYELFMSTNVYKRFDPRVTIGKPRVSPLLSLNTSAVIRYLICVYASHFFAGRRITSIKHCAPRISSKMATIDECIEFALEHIGLWRRYEISRHCDESKYIIIGRIFESEIILIPPSLKISESSSNGSYRNTDEVWWRYEISRSCDECHGWWRERNVSESTVGYLRWNQSRKDGNMSKSK